MTWQDIVVAIALAIIFAFIVAVIFEVFNVGTRIRDRLRRLRDKWSNYSAAQLRKRIAEVERYRATFTSDKGIYLGVFRVTLVMLASMSMGWAVLILGHTWPFRSFFSGQVPLLDFWALFFFALVVIGAIQGVHIAGLDTKTKTDEMIGKLDDEIAGLREQLRLLEQREHE
jgi:hypothetical protein